MLIGARGAVKLYDTRAYLNVSHFWADIARMQGPVSVARFRVHRHKVTDFELLPHDAADVAAFRPSTQVSVDAVRRVLRMFTDLAPLRDGDLVTLRAMRETCETPAASPPAGKEEAEEEGVHACALCVSTEDVVGGVDIFSASSAAPVSIQLSPGFMAVFQTAGTRRGRTPLSGHGTACRIEMQSSRKPC